MPDQLYLSLWFRDYTPDNMLDYFEQLLRLFPFSNIRPGIAGLKIYALEYAEPPALEHAFAGETDAETVAGMCGEFENPDSAYIVDAWWDLFKYNGAWQLTPSRVSLTCYGPEFENDERDHLRIDFGPDAEYLPRPDLPDSARAMQSNLTSVLRLVSDLEEVLPIERKKLWSEGEENFAERLESAFDE